jgi:thiamine-phosphate pyrophosphorylase
MSSCRLYLITPPRLPDLKAFCGELEAAMDGGDVAALQIRLKGVEDDVIRRAAEALTPMAHRSGARSS